MAQGYLVTLGDGKLDPGDTITGTVGTFTVDRDLGDGTWQFSGDVGGTTYVDEIEPGRYVLADNGNVYFIPDFGMVDSVSSASVVSHNSDGIVSGTDGNDTIDPNSSEIDGDTMNDGDGGGVSGDGDHVEAGGGNDSVSSGSDNDTVYGGSGDDTISGGSGDDHLYGGTGNDSIEGGSGDDRIEGGAQGDTLSGGTGNDTIYGDDNGPQPVTISTANYTDTSNGFTLTAQNIEGGALSAASSDNISVAGGALGANGAVTSTDSGQNSQIAYDTGTGLSENLTAHFDDPVTQASFSFQYLFTADFAETGHWAVYDNGVLVAEGDFSETTPSSGSGTIDISGVGQFDQLVLSANIQSDGSNGSDYAVSAISFTPQNSASSDGNDSITGGDGDDVLYGEGGEDTIRGEADNDEISGGTGSDSLDGGSGDDTIYASEGDTVLGGDGDDTIILQDLGEAGSGNIFVDGGANGSDDYDVLDLSQVDYTNLNITATDTLTGEMSGNLTLDDGSVVYFNNIEHIACFAGGTRLQTPDGPRAIECIGAGDMVLTRDGGAQPVLCVAGTKLCTTAQTRTVRFAKGAWGNTRAVAVSQNHRVVLSGPLAQLHYGEPEVLVAAKTLVGRAGITLGPLRERLTLYHVLLPQHALVFSEGLISESFFPTALSLSHLGASAQADMRLAMIGAGLDVAQYGPAVRRIAKPYEAACLSA